MTTGSVNRAGHAVRRLACLVALGAWMVGAGAAHAADSAVVVMYHRFGEGQYPSTNIRLDQFEAHLAEIQSGLYTVLPLAEIVRRIRVGEPLPERTLGISIDDAYRSVYAEAWPRLREAGLPFTLFVATDAVDAGGANFMTWDQIRELAAAGVTIGSQTASHPHMPDLSPERNRAEIEKSNARFEAELGRKPELFAYPFGEASRAVMDLVAETGFAAAFGQHSGVAHRTADRFYLPRFAFNEAFGDLQRFRLAGGALPLPIADLAPNDPMLAGNNPPAFGFTVAEGVGGLDSLRCFASGQSRTRVEHLGDRRIEVRLTEPFAPGRARINCTMPGPGGRWRWYGVQFYIPKKG